MLNIRGGDGLVCFESGVHCLVVAIIRMAAVAGYARGRHFDIMPI